MPFKHKCPFCNKFLSSKQRLEQHIDICNGVNNPCICHKCFQKFNNRNSKCTHLKDCYAVQPYLGFYKDVYLPYINNNINNNINNHNNHSNNNNINTHSNPITYNNLPIINNPIPPFITQHPHSGILYLVQPAELIGTQRFKIGCSQQHKLYRLTNGYKIGTKYLCIMESPHVRKIEHEIKSIFNHKFILIAGTEYFEGDQSLMLKTFIEHILKYQ
jgi:hypothetical protein